MLKNISLCAVLIGTCLLSACQSSTDTKESAANMATLSGEVVYREKIIMKKGSTLKVVLVNTTKQDIKADVISQAHYTLNNPQPYAFSLKYDKSKINPQDTYSIQARIEVNGKLRFISTEAFNPFMPGNENPSITVKAIGASANTQATEGTGETEN